MVWKDLGFRRIGKSLERVRVRDDVKGHGFLMVYTWCAHVQQRLKVLHQGTCRKYGSLKVKAWWMDMRKTHCCSTVTNFIQLVSPQPVD